LLQYGLKNIALTTAGMLMIFCTLAVRKKITAKLAAVFQIPYCSNTPDVACNIK
jgi:hypothetical protein